MPDLALDLRYLKYAMLVAQLGSFRAAANSLNLSQSTVSRRIQLLERRLGVPLFERGYNGVRLTFAGQKFLDDAKESAAQLQETVKNIRAVHRGEVGELRLGFMTSLASGYLPDLLDRFRRRFPRVEVRLEEMTSEVAYAGLIAGRTDIALLPHGPDIEGCSSMPLWTEMLFLAVPANHKLAGLASVKWDDIKTETFLVPAGMASSEIHCSYLRHLSRDGFTPSMSPHSVGRENLLNMVGDGFGVLFVPSSATGSPHRNVHYAEVAEAPNSTRFGAVWSTRNGNPILKPFLDLATKKPS